MGDYQHYSVDEQRTWLINQIHNYESQQFQHEMIVREQEAAADGEADDDAGKVRADNFRAAAADARRNAIEAKNRASVHIAALKQLDDAAKSKSQRQK